MKLHQAFVSLSVATLLLSACGGGGDDPAPAPAATPATQGVPADAQTSSASAATYMAALVAVDPGSSDSLEPISALPDSMATDDTSEPRAVD